MEIILENIGKRYGSQWVFKEVNYQFSKGKNYALIGRNGAGKSTLLNIIVGKIPFTKGALSHIASDRKIAGADLYKFFSIASTSMSLIEEFTLRELLQFHFRFRKSINQLEVDEILDILQLRTERKKFVSDFSSGMKQRLKIGLAILSKSSVLILDEPGANLDNNSKLWFQELLLKYKQDRTLIIASNDEEDYAICDNYLDISSFKPA